jgi:hypothetical protein
MATPTELSVLLRLYANKQNSPTILISEFCDYIQKYSRHYLQDAPDLVVYLDDTASVVLKELERLQDESKITIGADAKERKTVFVPHFYIDRIVQRYRELDERTELPFPLSTEIPSGFPAGFVKPVYITTDFNGLIEGGERTNAYINQLIFPDDTPAMVYPASLSPEKLLDLSMSKIRFFLRKDESKDYIQKRLMLANPGKELTIKNHLLQFQTRPSESLSAFRHSGDAFLFWSYLCSFIRQDFTKKAEKTPEENALLQAVFITEYLNNFYKSKAQQDLMRETALKNLELAFQKPPYFFDMETIQKFADSRGVPLLGQYRSADLESFIKEKTGDEHASSLPPLLVFKTDAGKRYFLLKEKVIPLVIRLCNEGRTAIKDALTREWFAVLRDFGQDDAMKSTAAFEKKIESLCKSSSPALFALLQASFIPLLALEDSSGAGESANGFRMFDHGRLLPLGALLMLDQKEILTDARILLPFWYTIPIVSSILAFFKRPRNAKKAPKKTAKKIAGQRDDEDEADARDEAHRAALQKKRELKDAVANIEKKMIPEDSTLEQELDTQLDLWNRHIDMGIKENLTEDVNSLIRDYMKKTIKTIRASTFDRARVENLASALVDTPSLQKVKNQDALHLYIQLYILQILRSLK